MRLRDRYAQLTTAQRRELAQKAGIGEKYLYQIAVRWRGRRPSLLVMSRLAEADKKLTLKDLVAEFSV